MPRSKYTRKPKEVKVVPTTTNALELAVNLPTGETTIKLTHGKRAVGTFVMTPIGVMFLPANAKRTRKLRPTLSWDMLGRFLR